MKRIINFSGGKSSALMTILEYNPETDYVVFCDTGREYPKTYKFILDFEANENIPVIKIGYKKRGFEYVSELGSKDYFREYLANRSEKELPNMQKRSCTMEMKIKTTRRWARKNIGMSYVNMIGFRSEETERVLRNKKRWQQVIQKFPLYEREINKEMVKQFWMDRHYTLKMPSILGNCTLCFMKGKDAIITILKHFPELANDWIEDEKNTGRTYLSGITIEQCLKIQEYCLKALVCLLLAYIFIKVYNSIESEIKGYYYKKRRIVLSILFVIAYFVSSILIFKYLF